MTNFGCSANFTPTIMPEDSQETVDAETPVNTIQQSVPDENPGDKIVHGLDASLLAEAKLLSTIRKSAQIHRQIHLNNYTDWKWTLPFAARLLMQPQKISNAHEEIPVRPAVSQFHNTSLFDSSRVFAND